MKSVGYLINLFKALGINAKIEDGKIYFSDIKTGEKYSIVKFNDSIVKFNDTKYFYGDKSDQFGWVYLKEYYDPFYSYDDLLLLCKKSNYRTISIQFNRLKSGEIIINSAHLLHSENNVSYTISYSEYFNLIQFEKDSNNDFDRIYIGNNGFIYTSDQKTISVNLINTDVDFNLLCKVMEDKICSAFIEYYSMFDVGFIETYNNCLADNSYNRSIYALR